MTKFLTKLWSFLHMPKRLQIFILRFFHDEFLIGVVGVIFNKKNEILLFKHTYREVEWALPGGYINAKEHPQEGLEREIEEESGFVVSVDEALKIRTDRETARLEVCYIGTFLGGEFKKSAEVSNASFFSFDSLPIIPRRQLLLIDYALKRKVRKIENTFKPNVAWRFLNKLKTISN